MVDCINQSQLYSFLWTDPGWFIYQLEVRIVFDPQLHDLKLPVLEHFHFVF